MDNSTYLTPNADMNTKYSNIIHHISRENSQAPPVSPGKTQWPNGAGFAAQIDVNGIHQVVGQVFELDCPLDTTLLPRVLPTCYVCCSLMSSQTGCFKLVVTILFETRPKRRALIIVVLVGG